MSPATQQKEGATRVRLPERLQTLAEEYAAERGMNLSEFIRYALYSYIDKTPKVPG